MINFVREIEEIDRVHNKIESIVLSFYGHIH